MGSASSRTSARVVLAPASSATRRALWSSVRLFEPWRVLPPMPSRRIGRLLLMTLPLSAKIRSLSDVRVEVEVDAEVGAQGILNLGFVAQAPLLARAIAGGDEPLPREGDPPFRREQRAH